MVFDTGHGAEMYGAYAAGALDPALQLMIETQAELRADVRTRLAQADVVAGAFLEQERPAPMSFGAMERALAAIDTAEEEDDRRNSRAAARAGEALNELIRLPEPLRDRVLSDAADKGWKFAGPGLRIMPLDTRGEATAELLRIEPGCGSPAHSHKGVEYTLVLAGGFTDETGSYGPGDISIAGPDTLHRPIADEGEVCFALAVRDGGLAFKGFLGFVQRVFDR